MTFVKDQIGLSDTLKVGHKIERGWIKEIILNRADDGPILNFMRESGLIEINNGYIRLTQDGALFYNTP